MAKYEAEGYCPEKDVWDFLDKENATDDRRALAGLWSIICESIVYPQNILTGTIDKDTVVRIFTSDSIAPKLMTDIVKYNANASKIRIKQPRICLGNHNQCLYDIQKKLGETKNPQLVLAAGSNYAVIIAETEGTENELDVYVWDLAISY